MKIKTITLVTAILVCFLANAQNNSLSVSSDFETFSSAAQFGINTSSISSFSRKQETVGSQYLFTTWVNGSVTNNAGVTFKNGLFNFDKISQNIYIKISDSIRNAAFLVDKKQLKSISLNDGTTSYLFEKISSLNNDRFYNALAKGKKYSLYSYTKTTFIPSNYESNGIVTSGNLYDEYKDELSYYVVFADGSAHEISFKKKTIKSLFEPEKDKVDEFFKTNESLPLDEKFLSLLVENLNQ
jgi:hypothetical protein